MKKMILIIFAIFIFAGFSFGKTLDDPVFAPVLPDIIGRGNAVTSTAHGYGALFTNPAGFSKDDGSFTLLSTSINPYFFPNSKDIDGFSSAGSDPVSAIEKLSELIVTNGIGANANTGIAVVGKGLGLGLIFDVDSYGRGKTALGTEVDVVGTLAVIGGLSFNITPGPFSIHLGGDLRYMHRIKMENVAILELIEIKNSDVNVYTGNALALDLGAIVDLGPWSFGMSIRDIGGTKFVYESVPVSDYGNGSIDADKVDDDYRIPMAISTGFGYHPDFGSISWLIDPTFNLEYQHVYYADPDNTPSFWTGIHAGTEIRVLKIIKLRGGLNQGYFTAGLGAKLLFMDINVAYFTREMSEYAGVDPNSGISLEVAIRF